MFFTNILTIMNNIKIAYILPMVTYYYTSNFLKWQPS